MTVFFGSELFLAVVDMKYFQIFKTDNVIEIIHGFHVFFWLYKRITGGKNVAGIQTDPDMFFILDFIDNISELFEFITQNRPLSGS